MFSSYMYVQVDSLHESRHHAQVHPAIRTPSLLRLQKGIGSSMIKRQSTQSSSSKRQAMQYIFEEARFAGVVLQCRQEAIVVAKANPTSGQ